MKFNYFIMLLCNYSIFWTLVVFLQKAQEIADCLGIHYTTVSKIVTEAKAN